MAMANGQGIKKSEAAGIVDTILDTMPNALAQGRESNNGDTAHLLLNIMVHIPAENPKGSLL